MKQKSWEILVLFGVYVFLMYRPLSKQDSAENCRWFEITPEMTTWKKEQLIFVTNAFIEKRRSITVAQRRFNRKHGVLVLISPTKKVIYRCVKNFRDSSSTAKKLSLGRPYCAILTANVENAKKIVVSNPTIIHKVW